MHRPVDPYADNATWKMFRGELQRATVANMRHPVVESWRTPQEAMAWLRSHLPYRFVPTRETADLWTALGRGWGSCGEAAAAWARRRGKRVVWALERRPDLDPAYAHVVARVDGRDIDVYAEAARPVGGASFIWEVP